jgi:hypothetical protein
MEKNLLPVVVITSKQSWSLGFLNDQLVKCLNLSHLAPTRYIELR